MSVPKLYKQVLEFLTHGNYLEKLPLPVATGSKRYLLAREPKHQSGNAFVYPVEHKGYFMEAHKGREGGWSNLQKLLEMCGLSMEVSG